MKIKIGTLHDRELKKKVRKALPPTGAPHKTPKDYSRKKKHKKKPEDWGGGQGTLVLRLVLNKKR